MPILNIILAGALLMGADDDVFEMNSQFGAESQWTEADLNDAWKVLVRLMDAPGVVPPRGIRVSLEKDPDMQGIGGYASPLPGWVTAASAENPRYARSLRVITYLSLACGENLADLCASHGIGEKPEGWEDSHPDESFETYRVTAKDVERMIAKR